ncbi:MAG: zinc-binding dehydrogenase [Balneolaceae bacterium]|nr:zinc-binding dehydrogenase [Balneolaceae bacterium]MBO6545526.1 zinc-binding dehydrogenase [Balneolaceae bacterium]MBO6646922.1 zinc-binding dehydrogenase [Balneolaceae bacterium]
MRQLVNTKTGGYDVLEVQEVPDLSPGDDELLIQVKAAGLNFADILARKGQYPDGPKTPCVMGYESSGIVKEVGSTINKDWVGKEVIVLSKFKGQASQVVVKEFLVFEKPKQLSFVEAASIPVTYLTAWALMVVMGGLKKGESILIHNAGGGVGLAQLDIAQHLGAVSYGTASERKHEFLKKRGLDYAIDYRNKDWFTELMKLTDNKGVELVTDPLGGKEWKKSYKALRATGRLGMFGVSVASKSPSGGLGAKLELIKAVLAMPTFKPISLLDKNRGVFGVNLGHLWHETEKTISWMHKILDGVEDGWVRPHVDKTFPLEEAAEAHRYIEERKNIGKVVLTV